MWYMILIKSIKYHGFDFAIIGIRKSEEVNGCRQDKKK